MSDEIKLMIAFGIFTFLFLSYINSLMKRGGEPTKAVATKTKKPTTKEAKPTLDQEAKEVMMNLKRSKSIIKKLRKADDKKSKLALKRIGVEASAICIDCEV